MKLDILLCCFCVQVFNNLGSLLIEQRVADGHVLTNLRVIICVIMHLCVYDIKRRVH